MSMTQVAFLKKAEIPTKKDIENSIRSLGYDFEILDNINNLNQADGCLSCRINLSNTSFEIYFDKSNEITEESSWIELDLTDRDIAISFIWGADFAAGACIGLISIALIDICNAEIYYLDDEMKYTREMLITDIPQFLKEIDK